MTNSEQGEQIRRYGSANECSTTDEHAEQMRHYGSCSNCSHKMDEAVK